MKDYSSTLEAISKHSSKLDGKYAVLGFDGFVDKIVRAVDQRTGSAKAFTSIEAIKSFAKRIDDAAGKSTNIELVTQQEKIGGNGPIMANALAQSPLDIHYLGALGKPDIHPLFKDFAKKTNAISVANVATTYAMEFQDGKVMLQTDMHFDEITYKAMVEASSEGVILDTFSRADLVCMLNWTMIPNMNGIMCDILETVLPTVGPKENRTFFFDFADPTKRSEGDLRSALEIIKRFQHEGHVILGLNLNESHLVSKALGLDPSDDLKKTAERIRQKMDIGTVAIHGGTHSAAASKGESAMEEIKIVEAPKILTGAGDHFNAGFVLGHLMEVGLEPSIDLGNAQMRYYIENGHSPTLSEVVDYLSA